MIFWVRSILSKNDQKSLMPMKYEHFICLFLPVRTNPVMQNWPGVVDSSQTFNIGFGKELLSYQKIINNTCTVGRPFIQSLIALLRMSDIISQKICSNLRSVPLFSNNKSKKVGDIHLRRAHSEASLQKTFKAHWMK